MSAISARYLSPADQSEFSRPADVFSLRLVPLAEVVPHEEFHEQRVEQLAQRLQADGVLSNPPIVAELPRVAAEPEAEAPRYVVLDGATRTSALQRLGYAYAVVQVADLGVGGVELYAWNHVIRREAGEQEENEAALLALMQKVSGLHVAPSPAAGLPVEPPASPLPAGSPRTLARVALATGRLIDLQAAPSTNGSAGGERWMEAVTALVRDYGAWANVERTLTSELAIAQAMYGGTVALVEFPRLGVEQVLATARAGRRLPAGITRFVIPERILRLNLPLALLASDEPLLAKQAELDQFLRDKLDRRGVRRYEESVVLLDE